jgi:hypothetical protein
MGDKSKHGLSSNRDTWNIQGVIGTGDYVADPAKGATSDWAGFANDLNDFVAAGMPVVAARGITTRVPRATLYGIRTLDRS